MGTANTPESPKLELGTRLWDSCWAARPGSPAPAQRRRQARFIQPCSRRGGSRWVPSRGGKHRPARQRASPEACSRNMNATTDLGFVGMAARGGEGLGPATCRQSGGGGGMAAGEPHQPCCRCFRSAETLRTA